jgi:t-SNARE complex subunit (syntaxin)
LERKLAEISELQEFMALKVDEQTTVINSNLEMAVESKGNVDEGVEQLIRAAKIGVDFRICVLLFLIVSSLALLFLDWMYT